MASTQRVVKSILGMVGTMGLGIALWAGMTPDEVQMKARAKVTAKRGDLELTWPRKMIHRPLSQSEGLAEINQELSCSSPQHQAYQRYMNSLVMASIKEAAETNENVTRRTWPWKK